MKFFFNAQICTKIKPSAQNRTMALSLQRPLSDSCRTMAFSPQWSAQGHPHILSAHIRATISAKAGGRGGGSCGFQRSSCERSRHGAGCHRSRPSLTVAVPLWPPSYGQPPSPQQQQQKIIIKQPPATQQSTTITSPQYYTTGGTAGRSRSRVHSC